MDEPSRALPRVMDRAFEKGSWQGGEVAVGRALVALFFTPLVLVAMLGTSARAYGHVWR